MEGGWGGYRNELLYKNIYHSELLKVKIEPYRCGPFVFDCCPHQISALRAFISCTVQRSLHSHSSSLMLLQQPSAPDVTLAVPVPVAVLKLAQCYKSVGDRVCRRQFQSFQPL